MANKLPVTIFSFLHLQYYPKRLEVVTELGADFKVFTKGGFSYTWVPNMPYFESDTKKYCSSWKLSISSTQRSEQVKEETTYHNQWTSELKSLPKLRFEVQFIHEYSGINFCIFRLQKKLQKEIIFLFVTHYTTLQRLYFNFIYCIYFKIEITYWRALFQIWVLFIETPG